MDKKEPNNCACPAPPITWFPSNTNDVRMASNSVGSLPGIVCFADSIYLARGCINLPGIPSSLSLNGKARGSPCIVTMANGEMIYIVKWCRDPSVQFGYSSNPGPCLNPLNLQRMNFFKTFDPMSLAINSNFWNPIPPGTPAEQLWCLLADPTSKIASLRILYTELVAKWLTGATTHPFY